MRHGTLNRGSGTGWILIAGVVAAALVVGIGGAFAGDLNRLGLRDRPVLNPPTSPDNGYNAIVTFATSALQPDGDWVSFTWKDMDDGAIVFDKEGPFEFYSDTPVTLRVTDDFCRGDQFRIYDNGVEVGETFWTEPYAESCHAMGADNAFAFASMASAIFQLGPGDHSIRIEVIDNPWNSGRAYLRVYTEQPMPTFVVTESSEKYGTIHATDRFAFTATFSSIDGLMFPDAEETVIWFGKYLEVIPPEQFVCAPNVDTTVCTYAQRGLNGISSAVITINNADNTGSIQVEGKVVDLCPGSNPHWTGVWVGDEGGSYRNTSLGNLTSRP